MAGCILMGLQFQLERSQWLSAETIRALQLRQIERLVAHAYRTVPYYKEAFAAAGVVATESLTPDNWSQVPLLTRESLQEHGDELLSRSIPEEHGQTFEKKTSGSTGRQIVVTDTEGNRLFWQANTLRDHLWHQRNFRGHLAAIRSGRSAKDPLLVKDHQSWGNSTGQIYETGPSTVFYQRMPIWKQAEVLQARNPEYLLAYPGNAVRLADYFRAHALQLPNLREVMTYGESILPETRSACRDAWGVSVSDMYSCEEVGYIALQCPKDDDNYHCQAESVLVEVIDDEGRPCQAGEIGRVVLTVLHNFAMPLIRYENQDYAEVGAPCACGRGLPVIKRILGRKRNMARAVDGRRFWTDLPPEIWSNFIGLEELQLVQDEPDHIELRIVAEQPLNETHESSLTAGLGRALGQPYRFSVRYQHETLRLANGKYERFICQV